MVDMENLFEPPEPEQEEEVSLEIFEINEADLSDEIKNIDAFALRLKNCDNAKINRQLS